MHRVMKVASGAAPLALASRMADSSRLTLRARNLLVLALAWTLIGWGVSRADTLQLLGAGPTGTVYLTAPSLLPAPYNTSSGVNVYSGILDWTTVPGSGTPNFYTYCVDIASVISPGSSYTFDSAQTISNASLFSPAVINAIDNLWQDQPTLAEAAGGFSDSAPGITNQQASEFQIALWDIIYNGSSGTLENGASSSSPLYFSDDSPSGSIAAGLAMANQAYNLDTRNNSNYQNVGVLVTTDGGQNQSIYISSMGGGPMMSSVPLPGSFLSGLVLFGLVGATNWRRINKFAVV